MAKNNKKIFMVMNLGYFGDVIVTSALCADIKRNYPDSELLFMVNPPCYDIAKNIPGVDHVYSFDKRGAHKGLKGMLKFIFSFKYWGKVDYCFMIHSYHRGNILALLLGAKRRIAENTNPMTNFLVTDLYPFNKEDDLVSSAPMIFANRLRIISGKPPQGEICFNCPDEDTEKASVMLKDAGYDKEELIGLSTCSREIEKDWNAHDAADFITRVNKSGRKVVFTGTQTALALAEQIRAIGVTDFLDLSGKTTILETAGIIQHCKAFVSVDTGSMHLSCALQKPTLALFFIDKIKTWGPKNISTNSILFNPKGISGQECFEALEKLLVKI